MRNRRLRPAVGGLCVLAGLLLVPPVPASAAQDRGESLSQKIERERHTLEKLKRDIREQRRHSDESERKRVFTLQEIQDLDDHLLATKRERAEINRQIKQKDAEIETLNGRIASLRSRMAERRGSILARVRVQYMEGRFGYLKALLASNRYGDLQRRLQYLSAISRREYELIQSYQEDVGHLQEAERQRADVRNEMVRFKQQTDRKLEEVKDLKQRKDALLARITREKESYDRAVAELERSASQIDALLKELEQRRKAALAKPKRAPETARLPRGNLLWPAEGDVVSFFGRQKHPVFDTYVHKKGIEIRTPEGSPIRAVMDGAVAYADWLKGYGLVVILDHGNGFFSLYAHASKLLVKVEEAVRAGHIIGETGDTGVTGESTLYFELREGATAVDPLAWLGRRK